MTDYISRQAAIDEFGLSEKTRKYGGDHSGYSSIMLYEVQGTLEDIPAADVVEVVRCRDCKHYDMYDMRCNKLHIIPIPEFCYCLYGEKERNYEPDLAEVVRCRDCKHHNNETEFCKQWSIFGTVKSDGNDYCSYGERADK